MEIFKRQAKSTATAPEIRDGDGDGLIYDGTENERSVSSSREESVSAGSDLKPHEMTSSEYSEYVANLKPLPNKLMELGGVYVVQNPTSRDYRFLKDIVREKYPNMPRGEGATRFTNDKLGNKWVWPAHEAVHFQMEPLIEKEIGRDVDQNFEIPRHTSVIKDALFVDKLKVPKRVLESSPRFLDYIDLLNDEQREAQGLSPKNSGKPKAYRPEIKDGDGDGLIYDGTPDERAVATKEGSQWGDWKDPDSLDAVKWSHQPNRRTSQWEVAGQKFFGHLYPGNIGKSRGLEYSFTTEDGTDKLTGKSRGSAYKVMKNAVLRVGSAIKNDAPDFVFFRASGSEPSRVDLYRFMTKRSGRLFPGYVGVEMVFGDLAKPSAYNFAVVKRSSLKELEGQLPKSAKVKVLGQGVKKSQGSDSYEVFDEAFWQELEDDLVSSVEESHKKAMKPEIKDGDGDGKIYDGTPDERPVAEKPDPLVEKIRQDGGFTYQPANKTSPTKGYSVAVFPDREVIVDSIDDLTPGVLWDFMQSNMDTFANDERVHFGAWYNHEKTEDNPNPDHKIYLDMSMVIDDLEEATQLAKSKGQLGIFDLANFETIETLTPDERREWERQNASQKKSHDGPTRADARKSKGVRARHVSDHRRQGAHGRDGRGLGRQDGSVEAEGRFAGWPECLARAAKSFSSDKYARRLDALNERRGEPKETIAAGLAVIAKDTGRILLLQRSISEDDPASGRWEAPGGHIEEGEDPYDAARREWEEEVGIELPDGELKGWWASNNGVYEGYLFEVENESDLKINPSLKDREVENPDDLEGEWNEVVAWWDILDMRGNPVIRQELLESMPDVEREVFGLFADWIVNGKRGPGAANKDGSRKCVKSAAQPIQSRPAVAQGLSRRIEGLWKKSHGVKGMEEASNALLDLYGDVSEEQEV